MIFVYILLFIIAVPIIGKLINRQGDAAYKRTASRGSMSAFRFSRSHVDPEENPRAVDDGTEYGYKEFD